jgi:hypothetical protein
MRLSLAGPLLAFGLGGVGRPSIRQRDCRQRLFMECGAQRRERVSQHAGAIAFSRTGHPAAGEFYDAAILAQFDEVDLDAALNG